MCHVTLSRQARLLHAELPGAFTPTRYAYPAAVQCTVHGAGHAYEVSVPVAGDSSGKRHAGSQGWKEKKRKRGKEKGGKGGIIRNTRKQKTKVKRKGKKKHQRKQNMEGCAMLWTDCTHPQ